MNCAAVEQAAEKSGTSPPHRTPALALSMTSSVAISISRWWQSWPRWPGENSAQFARCSKRWM